MDDFASERQVSTTTTTASQSSQKHTPIRDVGTVDSLNAHGFIYSAGIPPLFVLVLSASKEASDNTGETITIK